MDLSTDIQTVQTTYIAVAGTFAEQLFRKILSRLLQFVFRLLNFSELLFVQMKVTAVTARLHVLSIEVDEREDISFMICGTHCMM